MKKPIVLLSLLTISAAGLIGCKTTTASKVDAKKVFQMQAVTGLNMASPTAGPRAARRLAAPQLDDAQQKKVAEILPTVDTLFDNSGSGFESKVETVNKEIDGKNYEFQETISYLNPDLTKSSYVLVYNIDSTATETETPEESGAAAETETSSNLSGFAYLDDVTYFPFVSEVESETEGAESEQERVFKITTGADSYISIKEEFEVEGQETEQELHYVVVEAGVTTVDYKIEIEAEGNKNEIEIELGADQYEISREAKDDGTFYTVAHVGASGEVVCTFKKEVDADGNVAYVVA